MASDNYWDSLAHSEAVGNYTIHSGDTHVIEPRDLWTTRLERRFRDRAPHVERVGDRDFWFCEGKNFAHAGHKATRWSPENYTGQFDDQRPGGTIPDKCLEDSDLDGVDVNVFFPSPTITFYAVPDPELTRAILRAYNDWLAEFCAYDRRRLKGVAALLLPGDIEGAVAELERCVEMGFVGGLIPMLLAPDPTYDDSMYDRLWDAAQGMNVPLAMHITVIRPPQSNVPASEVPATVNAPSGSTVPLAYGRFARDALVRDNITAMIFGGVFERFPSLQIGCLEMGTGWIPSFMRSMDRGYLVRRGDGPRSKTFGDGMVPSDFIRRNVFFGFEDDDLGIRFRDFIGVDNLIYANDYPHPDCVWPRSRQVLEQMLTGCTEGEKSKLAGGNAARIFGLESATTA